jgi:hypothetical protein
MSHEIKYGLKDKKAAETKAIEDIASWLDIDKRKMLCLIAIGYTLAEATNPDEARIGLALTGIQGYPVEALWNHLHGK